MKNKNDQLYFLFKKYIYEEIDIIKFIDEFYILYNYQLNTDLFTDDEYKNIQVLYKSTLKYNRKENQDNPANRKSLNEIIEIIQLFIFSESSPFLTIEELHILLFLYMQNKISTSVFCDQLYNIYNFSDNRDLPEEKEKAWKELLNTTVRFTEIKEDLQDYPGVYNTEEDVQFKVYRLYDRLI